MKLLNLKLTNFKGVRSFELAPDGKNVSVYGTNASGKTTLFDALTWLLFDKGSDWGENFSPKTKDHSGEEVHNINNRVDGTFQLDDGRIITFSKDLSENWVKKRGGLSESFSGNVTEYFIDGVPVKQNEYKQRIQEICPIEKATILMQPLYFSQIMDWKSRRQMLLDVCGDVSEFHVINSNPELTEITRFLLIPGTTDQFYTVEECAKVADSKNKDIRKKLAELPARIDEATRAIVEIDADAEVLNGTLAILQKDLNEATAEKAALKQNGAEVQWRNQAATIKADMAEGGVAFTKAQNERLSADREKLKELTARWQELLVQKSGLSANIGMLRNKIHLLKSQRQQLADEHKKISEQVWQGAEVCPTCNRDLPPEEIEAAKSAFNSEKAKSLEEIRAMIEKNCSKSMISELETSLTIDERSYEALNKETEEINVEIRTLKDKISAIESEKFEDTEEYSNFAEKLAILEAQIALGSVDISKEENEIQAIIERISEDIENVKNKLLVIKNNEQQKQRIEELIAQEDKLQEKAEDCEHCLYLCELFIKTKVSMLNKQINAHFENVRFQLFKEQINGGLKEVCEVLVPSENGNLIPYSKTNAAAKLNAGLEIINTLSQHWGLSMPVVVDNAESIVKLKEIAPQVIRLVVSGEDKTLRVEREVD